MDINFNIYIDKPERILKIREACLDVMSNGGLILKDWTDEGTSVGYIHYKDLTEALFLACERFLQEYDPGKYGYNVDSTSVVWLW